MSSGDKRSNNAGSPAAAASAGQYDPAALLALYSMSNAYGLAPTTAAATSSASPSANLGLNQWWAMASQLAAQEYYTRIQAASRDPQAYAALAASGVLPNYEMLAGGSKSHKLPSDTEVFKYTSSATGSKEPGSSNRGRKKTISLDTHLSSADYANLAANVSSSSSDTTPPSIPSGITIERKRPGSKNSTASSEATVDRVEITKVPAVSNNGSTSYKSSTPKAESHHHPLNLSMKSPLPFMSPISTTSAGASSTLDNYGSSSSKSIEASKIPQEYYASQALSGVFLAEQIRQQQLAAALESRLDSQSFSAMQAALLMNKLKAGAAVAETSKLLAAAASAAASSSSPHQGEEKKKASKSSKKNKSNLSMGDKLNKTTVASLLAKSRELSTTANLTSEELEQAERTWPNSHHSELTIEPIFKALKPDQSAHSGDEFDSSDNGRRTTSVIEDGKLKIKTVSDSPEIRNLSDEAVKAQMHDSASESDDGGKGYGRYATIETDELRLPLKMGWKREITVREYSKSGIRGDVLYYAPCGKKFKQYPDIMRYLEKKGIKNLQREHFSFSTKVFIGDFLKPTGMCEDNGEEKYARLSEKQMYEDIDKLRRENGWKPRRRGSKSGSSSSNKGCDTTPTTSSSSTSASNNPLSSFAETLLHKMQAEMQLRGTDAQDSLRLQQEAIRILAEADRYEKMELSRREKEARQLQQQEAKRRRHEELQRHRQEEQLKKIQEREQKRQQTAILKEQAKQLKQYEKLLFHQTMERERRKQHMVLMKQLEARKRSDEREKKREELRIRTEREREKRVEQKRLELEVINEMRKPVEDMSLDDQKPLPDYKRIPGLRLSGEAFANTLMVYEFLHNFGETLGFDMDSLPTMDSLQAALLYDQEAEEELLSVVIHLVVCAIEDPGIPYFHKHTTILGQNLRQADITNTNVSEILRIFLTARGQVEVKLLHNLNPPEMLHAKDPRRETMYTPQKIEEYNEVLRKTKGHTYAEWVKDKSFLCLNPSEKSEVVAFICNELLNNKAVVHQIDNNVENIAKAKKDKWEAEANLKRLKVIQAKKFRHLGGVDDHDNHHDNNHDHDDSMSVVSETMDSVTPSKKRGGKAAKKANSSKKKQQIEDDIDESTNMSHDLEENAEDENLGPEELQKKIDKAVKNLAKKRDELAFIGNRVRVNDLGQDRYRRRYHHFAHAGGVFVEAIESAEPWKLEGSGMPHFLEDNRSPVFPKSQNGQKGDVSDHEEIDDNEEINDHEEEIDTAQDNKENVTKMEVVAHNNEAEEALAKLGHDIMVTPKTEVKFESNDDVKCMPKITPNGEKLNLFNHMSNLNMTLSPVILNGAVTITPKDPSQNSQFPMTMQKQHDHLASVAAGDKPWFSILPLGNSLDIQHKMNPDLGKTDFFADTITPQINALEAKLEELRGINLDKYREPIPKEFTRGWWRLSGVEAVNQLEASLNSRGTREQHLLTLVKRNFELLQDAAKNASSHDMHLEPPEEFEDMAMEAGADAPPMDEKGSWSREVALRVDKYILEQVEALEDKVASASMQVPGWKVPNKGDIDSRSFRPACLYITDEADPNDKFGPEATNPVEEARERLLDLELNIERRYLKAPLGVSNTVSLQTITTKIMNENDKEEEEMEQDQDQQQQPMDEGSPEAEEKPAHLPRGLLMWREGVKNAKTAAQLAMAFYILETSIAWHKSIMKAFCQLCHCGDNEDSLLLCDGCDKGYHTYCFKPSLDNIPEGDWFCYECINKATGVKHCLVCGKLEGKNLINCATCPRAYHTPCLSPALAKMPRGKWQCPGCNQKGPKKSKSRKRGPPTHLLHNANSDESPDQTGQNSPAAGSEKASEKEASPEKAASEEPPSPVVAAASEAVNPGPPPAKKKKLSKMDKDLTICHTVISEMEALENAWPFLYPVNTKQFPTYKKVIKTPMDIATIKKKLDSHGYKLRDEFVQDVRLIFTNCELFNEDDSPVGKAGHAMRIHFENRWLELTSM